MNHDCTIAILPSSENPDMIFRRRMKMKAKLFSLIFGRKQTLVMIVPSKEVEKIEIEDI